jgi:hypothetical protein
MSTEAINNGLDWDKFNLYINQDDKLQYKNIWDLVWKNTVYLTRNEVQQMIRNKVFEWSQRRNNLKQVYVLLPHDKIGSDHWIYLICRDLLPSNHQVIKYYAQERRARLVNPEIYESILSDPSLDCEFLFMDDWSLSGTHIAGSTEMFLLDIIGEGQNNLKNITFTIITAVMSNISKNNFVHLLESYDYLKRINIMSASTIKNLTEIMKENNIDTAEEESFTERFMPEGSSHLIHSDYKIANEFGTLNELYNIASKYPVNRLFMKEVETQF